MGEPEVELGEGVAPRGRGLCPDVERELLANLLDLIPHAVYWKDRSGRYLGANGAFAAMGGLASPQELVGRTDDELGWQIQSSTVPLRQGGDEVVGVLGILADVPSRDSTQLELMRMRQVLEDAVESIDAGLAVYDRDERFVFCNLSYMQMYREAASTMLPGTPLSQVLRTFAERRPELIGGDPDAWVAASLRHRRELAGDREEALGERCIRISDRRTADGGVVSLHTDITKEKAVQAELVVAKEVAERASQSKTNFLANMSHEIRTPMTAILGFAEDLLASTTAADHRQSLLTICNNGEHLLTLINDILDLSKIEAGKVDYAVEDVDVRDLVVGVRELMDERARAKGLTLSLEVPRPIPRTINTDGTRLRQVLVNLVGNAIKFTERGSVTMRIGMADDGKFAIEVVDTGIGMSPEQARRVFTAFEQADESTTRQFGGTGLGLTISQRIARALGGEITVESVFGRGSTFRFEFDPCNRACSLDVCTLRPSQYWLPTCDELQIQPRETPPMPKTDAMPLAGRVVLLAEDGRDNMRLLTSILRRAGATVATAENGQEAVAAVQERINDNHPIDLVLMDMQMPIMDGYAASRAIRDLGIAIPIVALTAQAMTGDRERCLAAGCDDYLTKPTKRAVLIETCVRFLDRDGPTT